MHCFYLTTKLKTGWTNYRVTMRELFISEHPELHHLTEQQLSDHEHAILRQNIIPEPILESISSEVEDKICMVERGQPNLMDHACEMTLDETPNQ